MFQTIETRYVGPSNSRGSRIKATSSGGVSRTFGYRNELSGDQNHIEAARALAEHLKWAGTWHVGATSRGCVFVLARAVYSFEVQA